ncbi:MAG TPA: LysR family transcriptional regulator, partial [Bacillota bacterium]|nr:LysR family transcriptional regulator [Bacillota bacterium]
FWVVAKEGSLKKASEKLHVSQPSMSEQIKELETALGEPLFRRSGRSNVLTDAGQITFRYAEEIFALGAELLNTIKQRPGGQTLHLYVGVADAFPKLVTNEILKPVLAMNQPVHVICREGKVEDLLAQLAAHRLDIVLADEPASSSLKIRSFNHLLGESSVTFCAAGKLAETLRKGFPQSLDKAPALLPVENTGMRRSLEKWFQALHIHPRVVAEFEDAALMKVMAAEGKGFIPVPTVVVHEALTRYRYHVIGATDSCRDQFYAITAERRISHPAVVVITEKAQSLLAR